MPAPILLTDTMLEGTSGVYSFNLVDIYDQGIDVIFLTSLTVTLYDVDSQTVINGRQGQDVLNVNGGTVVTTGTVAGTVTTMTMLLTPADTVMLNPNRVAEYRVLEFRWTWNNGQNAAAHAVQFAVEGLFA